MGGVAFARGRDIGAHAVVATGQGALAERRLPPAILYAYSVWVGSGSRSSEASFLFTLKFDAEGNSKIVKTQQMSDKEVEKLNE